MKITQEHIKATGEIFGSSSAEWLASVCNKAIEIAQAEAEQPKPVVNKQISWADMPVGIAVCCHEVPHYTTFIYQGGEPPLITQIGMGWQGLNTRKLTLAPAAEQPWLNWRGGECPVPAGVIVEFNSRSGYRNIQHNQQLGTTLRWKHYDEAGSGDIIEYRIVGIESGYELGGLK